MRSLAQRIDLLEHKLQMSVVKSASEVVNHPDTLFLPDGTNLLGDSHFQFSCGLRPILIHVVLQERTPYGAEVVYEQRIPIATDFTRPPGLWYANGGPKRIGSSPTTTSDRAPTKSGSRDRGELLCSQRNESSLGNAEVALG